MKPSLSICCMSYGRIECLREATESFLRQDYDGPAEFIILNDCEHIDLVLDKDHPDVTVINEKTRYPNMGAKLDAFMEYMTGDVFVPWGDDDLVLPWGLSYVAEQIEDRPYMECSKYFWMIGDDLKELKTGQIHGASAYTTDLLKELGGHGDETWGVDIKWMMRVGEKGVRYCSPMSDDEAYYIYRWGNYPYQMSGYGPECWEKTRQTVEELIKPGEYVIEPTWKHDYVKMSKELIK